MGKNPEGEKEKHGKFGAERWQAIVIELWKEGWELRAEEAWEKMLEKNNGQYVQIWGGWTPNPKIYRTWERALEVMMVEREKLCERGEKGKAFVIFS